MLQENWTYNHISLQSTRFANIVTSGISKTRMQKEHKQVADSLVDWCWLQQYTKFTDNIWKCHHTSAAAVDA